MLVQTIPLFFKPFHSLNPATTQCGLHIQTVVTEVIARVPGFQNIRQWENICPKYRLACPPSYNLLLRLQGHGVRILSLVPVQYIPMSLVTP